MFHPTAVNACGEVNKKAVLNYKCDLYSSISFVVLLKNAQPVPCI